MKLKEGFYSEIDLVNMLCSDKQRESYNRKNKFAGGNQRKLFLKELSVYCEFEKGEMPKTYNITKIFDIPKTIEQERINKGLYQYLSPLILDEVKKYGEEKKLEVTFVDFADKVGISNGNYLNIKCHKKVVSKELNIPMGIMRMFFSRADNRVRDYISRCLTYLKNDGYLDYNEIYIIQTFKLKAKAIGKNIHISKTVNKHKASNKEIKLYNKLKEKAAEITGVSNSDNYWYGKGSEKFRKLLKESLSENNIDYVTKGYEIWCVNPKKCSLMLESSLKKEENIEKLKDTFKNILDNNAEQRARKNQPSEYLDYFKRLTFLTLTSEAEDIRNIIPDWNKDLGVSTEKVKELKVHYKEVKGEVNVS